jgi:hypothetical protein
MRETSHNGGNKIEAMEEFTRAMIRSIQPAIRTGHAEVYTSRPSTRLMRFW